MSYRSPPSRHLLALGLIVTAIAVGVASRAIAGHVPFAFVNPSGSVTVESHSFPEPGLDDREDQSLEGPGTIDVAADSSVSPRGGRVGSSITGSVVISDASVVANLLATFEREPDHLDGGNSRILVALRGNFTITERYRYDIEVAGFFRSGLSLDAGSANLYLIDPITSAANRLDEISLLGPPELTELSDRIEGVIEPGEYLVTLQAHWWDFGENDFYPQERPFTGRFAFAPAETPIPLPPALWPALACLAACAAKTTLRQVRRR